MSVLGGFSFGLLLSVLVCLIISIVKYIFKVGLSVYFMVFFFFQWGTEQKQEQMFGVNLDFKCPCKNKKFNLIFNLKRSYIFWVIPIGSWAVDDAFVQCPKCGRAWQINDKSSKVQNLYNELKESSSKLSNKKHDFKIKTESLFVEFSSDKKFFEKEAERMEEIKELKEQDNNDFIIMLKAIGFIAGVVLIYLLLRWIF